MNNIKLKHILKIVLFSTVFFNACKKLDDCKEHTKQYLHLSHTRIDTDNLVHQEVFAIDFSRYDMLFLGGDLLLSSSENDANMQYLDNIFDIGNQNTLWSLGNHDYQDLNKIEQYTNRPNYYTYNKDKITYIVLDTQDSLSSIVGSQKEFLYQVLDTVQSSSDVVILHHSLIWMYNNQDLEAQIDTISNGMFGNCFFCLNPNNFYSDIYPKLLEVKQRGIEVLCIGGDIGQKVKEFEYTTTEGIHFLASGMTTFENDNKVLLFYHDIANEKLSWEFKLINELHCK